MNEDILYFIDYYDCIKVYTKTRVFYIKGKWKKILSKMCIKELTTLEGRIKAISQIMNIKYNIPIYINRNIIFFKINNSNSVYINYCNIKAIDYENKTIYFCANKKIKINKSKRSLSNLLKKINEIRLYFDSTIK